MAGLYRTCHATVHARLEIVLTIAQLLIDSHCHDVVTEPHLLPVDPERFQPSTNTQQEARLDIAATGLYSPFFRDKSFKEGIG